MLKDWEDAYDISFTSSFNVTGGEPFLRQDILEVLKELKDKGFDTYLLTNGILIDRDRAYALAELGLKGVQISIEGPEDIHDSIRGAGSFSSTIKGIRHLVDAGIELTLNTTLSDINASHFAELAALASSFGASRLGFSRLVPSGGGSKLMGRTLKKEALRDLYTKIFSLETKGLHIATGDPVASQLREPSMEDGLNPWPAGGCAAGVSGLTVLPDGTVTPCRRMSVPIGNVRRDSLRELWTSSEILNSLRDKSRYEGRCGRCRRWSSCRGCRAIAYAFSQADGKDSFLAEDPQCFLEN
jgi:radical SAM protein with 4Fe4S-binding SPASM domain